MQLRIVVFTSLLQKNNFGHLQWQQVKLILTLEANKPKYVQEKNKKQTGLIKWLCLLGFGVYKINNLLGAGIELSIARLHLNGIYTLKIIQFTYIFSKIHHPYSKWVRP